jgi:modulator of FtsH protease HflK
MSVRNVTPPKIPFPVKPGSVLFVFIGIVLIGTAFSSFFTVDQTEEAVVLRLGAYHRTVGPGLHLKMPFGLEQNLNVPTQMIRNEQFGFRTVDPSVRTQYADSEYPEESVMLTGDLNIIDVEWIIQYRIIDPLKWLFQVEDQRKTIRDISQSVVNQLVGDRGILDVIGSERTRIEAEALRIQNEIFDSYNLGISVTQVRLQNTIPPAGRVQDAFEDVNRAVQDMNRLINEGREKYNSEIPRARGQGRRLVQEAMGYAAERVNQAEGDATQFEAVVREYLANPAITRTRLYYETMESILGEDSDVLLIDRNLENLLPLLNLNSSTDRQGGTQ